MKNEKKNSIVSGFIWRFMERILAQLVTFIVSVVLARLLLPSDYGSIALIMVFIAIANVFVNDSFSSALIQSKEADDIAFSSVFYFNIIFSLVLYLCIFFLSPFVANFYDMPVLCPTLRVLAIQVPISSVKSVQQAYISRNMQFRKFFFSTIGGTIVSAFVGILMACKGFGVWAIVAQYLSNSVIDTIVLCFTSGWKPVKKFSVGKLIILLKYGSKILGANLIFTIYNQLRSLLIGKFYTADDLAYYTKGRSFPTIITENVVTSISTVLFPAMSSVQDDMDEVRRLTKKSIQVCSFVITPLMVGMASIAEPLVLLVLTDKWIMAVPYIRIVCSYLILQPLQTANLEAMKAIGKSGMYFKLELVKRTVGILILIITLPIGVIYVAYGDVLLLIICFLINAIPSKRYLNYGYKEQIMDILPNILKSLVMGGIVFAFTLLPLSNLILVFGGVFIGILVYILLSVLTRSKEFYYILNVIKNRFNKSRA